MLLLVHHGFSPLVSDPEHTAALSQLVSIAKLCVGIFAFLSGYGLYRSFSGDTERGFGRTIRFALVHLLKLMLTYWLIFAVMAGGLIAAGPAWERYGREALNVFLDFIGMAYLAGTPQFVNSWWYITAVICYYAAFPFLAFFAARLKWANWLVLLATAAGMFLFPRMNPVLIYGFFFLYGMIFAERNAFGWALNRLGRGRTLQIVRILIYVLLFAGGCLLRQRYLADLIGYYKLDWVLVVLLVLDKEAAEDGGLSPEENVRSWSTVWKEDREAAPQDISSRIFSLTSANLTMDSNNWVI